MLLGARQFFEKRGAPTPPLPYDAEVDWLYRTGNISNAVISPYIDVGFPAGTDVGVEITAKDTSSIIHAVMITGSFVGSGSGYWGIYNYARSNYKMWGSATRTIDISDATFYTYRSNFRNSKTMEIVQGGNTIYSSALIGSPTFNPANVWLGLINKGTYGQYEIGAVYISSAKYSIGSDVVRDFIPVRFTNELGESEGAMYDRVSGALFRNQGTGAFLYGPDKS